MPHALPPSPGLGTTATGPSGRLWVGGWGSRGPCSPTDPFRSTHLRRPTKPMRWWLAAPRPAVLLGWSVRPARARGAHPSHALEVEPAHRTRGRVATQASRRAAAAGPAATGGARRGRQRPPRATWGPGGTEAAQRVRREVPFGRAHQPPSRGACSLRPLTFGPSNEACVGGGRRVRGSGVPAQVPGRPPGGADTTAATRCGRGETLAHSKEHHALTRAAAGRWEEGGSANEAAASTASSPPSGLVARRPTPRGASASRRPRPLYPHLPTCLNSLPRRIQE